MLRTIADTGSRAKPEKSTGLSSRSNIEVSILRIEEMLSLGRNSIAWTRDVGNAKALSGG